MVDFINTVSDVKTLKAMAKDPGLAQHKVTIEARIAVLTQKPSWKYQLKLNDKGGIQLPFAVYLDSDGGTTGIQSVIDALEAAKSDARVKSYSK